MEKAISCVTQIILNVLTECQHVKHEYNVSVYWRFQ